MGTVKFIILFLFFYLNCYATQEVLIEVSQPNIHENGIAKTRSTYSRSIGHPGASYLILTFAENSISRYSSFQNKNLANLYKLDIKILLNSFSYGTIEAELILPENIEELEQKYGYSMTEVLNLSIDCLVENANVFYSDLDLKIDGDPKYSKFEKVYSTSSGETRKRNKYYSIQIKSFPVEKKAEALAFFNSFKETGLLTYMENAKVKGKEYLRIKIGYFTNMNDAELTGYILAKTKEVDFFITNFTGTVSNYDGFFKILSTPSGIWAKGRVNEKEIYNFVDETNLNLEKRSFDIVNEILKFNLNGKDIEINLKEHLRNL